MRSPSTVFLCVVLALVPGCYLAHERDDPGPAPDPVPPSFCPTPAGGSGLELALIHRVDGRRRLSIRAPGGELRAVTEELPETLGEWVVVAPGGRHANVGISFEEAVLVELEGGAVHPLAAMLPPSAREICGEASALPGTANGYTARFRPDGGAFLYGCFRYDGELRNAAGAWEIDLASLEVREVATDCAQADYPVNAPCDTQVTWSVCPGSDRIDAAIRSELRPLSGAPRPVAPRSWMLSPSTYLALDEEDPSTLVAVDAAGRERIVLSSVDLMTPLRFAVMPRRGGSAVVFASAVGDGIVAVDGAFRPLPQPCLGESSPRFVGLSPDGALMTVTCSESRRTFAIALDTGGGPVELSALAGLVGPVDSWSADGRYLLVGTPFSRESAAILVSRSDGEGIVIPRLDPALGEVLEVRLAYPAQ